MTPQNEPETIETQLRASAPVLPPELRSQILHRCRSERRNAPGWTWYRRWSFAGAFATLVLFCAVGSSQLDAQNRAMLTGGNRATSARSFAIPADTAQFVLALRWRISQLALLLHDKHSG